MSTELLMQGAIIVMMLACVARAFEQRRARKTTQRILDLVERHYGIEKQQRRLIPALGDWCNAARQLKERTLKEFPLVG